MFKPVLAFTLIASLFAGGHGQPTTITIDRLPSIVSIHLHQGDHICSGVLLPKKFVLTAASCLNSTTNSTAYVSVNTHQYKIKKIHNHPNYNSSSVGVYDISLLQLSAEVENASTVKMLELRNITDVSVNVTGRGLNNDQLFRSEATLLMDSNCRHKFRNTNVNITSTDVCAQFKSKDCFEVEKGASVNTGGKFYGIVSVNSSCDSKLPLVITIVHPLITWINKVIISSFTVKERQTLWGQLSTDIWNVISELGDKVKDKVSNIL